MSDFEVEVGVGPEALVCTQQGAGVARGGSLARDHLDYRRVGDPFAVANALAADTPGVE
jgi:hypothetical protein